MPSSSFSSLSSRLLLLLLAVVHGAVAARPLRGIAEPPSSSSGAAAGPGAGAQPREGGRGHDRSVAGAEVILAGFAAVVMVVIFCYIRATRKKNSGRVGPDGKKESLGGF